MNQVEITAATRRLIREPKHKTVSDTDITAMTLRGVTNLGLEIKAADPSYFRKRAILQSNHFEFALPSDCLSVEQVWDLRTTAKDITDASQATPIVVTSAAHGWSDDDVILIYGVGGNTAANGIHQIDNGDTNTFELKGSVGNAAYTSGGLAVKISSSWRIMSRFNPRESNFQQRLRFFISDENIVVDYKSFEYDILIYYLASPSAITDIPAEFHEGLIAFNVLNLMEMPKPEGSDYADKSRVLELEKNVYDLVIAQIRNSLKSSTEPKELYDVMHWDII